MQVVHLQCEVETGVGQPKKECELEQRGDRAGQAGLDRDPHKPVDDELTALEGEGLSLRRVELWSSTWRQPRATVLSGERRTRKNIDNMMTYGSSRQRRKGVGIE